MTVADLIAALQALPGAAQLAHVAIPFDGVTDGTPVRVEYDRGEVTLWTDRYDEDGDEDK